MLYILQIDYNPFTGHYQRAVLLHSFQEEEKAKEKLRSYKGHTGPHSIILLKLDKYPNTSDAMMTFGRYKGENLYRVPTEYLIWLYMQNVLTNDSIKAVLLDRAKIAKENMDRHNQAVVGRRKWEENREREQRKYYEVHRFELM